MYILQDVYNAYIGVAHKARGHRWSERNKQKERKKKKTTRRENTRAAEQEEMAEEGVQPDRELLTF